MPFIPHTESDIKNMLDTIGVSSIESLFDEIPKNLRLDKLKNIPQGLTEMQMMHLMKARAEQDIVKLNFIGAGAYEHHIPAAVWDIVTRGEFMTAYTPYQAEASQGTLQLLYEYQTMMTNLTGMDVSNASLYDGASGLAEAILMAVRIKKPQQPLIYIPETIHPHYLKTAKTIIENQHIKITHDINSDFTAGVIQQPNFYGEIEDSDNFTDLVHQKNALLIAVVNPLSLALLKEPGKWGQKGADIVCGELQPFGIPLSSGGPYAGFLCCKQEFVRQMPGRIVGATVDKDGKRGFTLTLQAREQHIRRGKATSNICTNQGLLVTAVTIYLSLLGFEGLKRVASACHYNSQYLYEKLNQIKNIKLVSHKSFFHEFVVEFEKPIEKILNELAKENILAGLPIGPNRLLICVTETKTLEELDSFVEKIKGVC